MVVDGNDDDDVDDDDDDDDNNDTDYDNKDDDDGDYNDDGDDNDGDYDACFQKYLAKWKTSSPSAPMMSQTSEKRAAGQWDCPSLSSLSI